MAAKFVMLALVAFSLAACETAATDDLSLRRNVGPTTGVAGHHKLVVRGPVVADAASVPAAKPATRPLVARVVPNPIRRAQANAPASSAAAAATVPAAPASAPTEPVQPASATSQSADAALPASQPPTVIGGYPETDASGRQASAPSSPSAAVPVTPGLPAITPHIIEQMLGGMPFLLIAAIAAALVASLGLALRRPSAPRQEYHEPRQEPVDHREPYAA